MATIAEVRKRAWITRRAKYGARGHAGSYSRASGRERAAIRLIAQLCEEGVLSEGQCCKALNMERVEFRTVCDEVKDHS